MTRSRLATALTASVLGLALAACQAPPAPPAPPEPPGPGAPAPDPAPAPPAPPTAACPGGALETETTVAALAEKARAQGTVRVIVEVKTPAGVQPASVQPSALQVFAQGGVRSVAPISDRLPYLVAEVTEAQLVAMYANPAFGRWTEDRIAFPSLVDSSPLVQAPQLWAIGGRGAGQAVAILDTGVDRTHPFFQNRVVAEACFSTTSAANGSTSVCPNGQSAQTGAGAARPCTVDGCEHGTHVAGIAAGRSDSFSGVAPDADIIAIQVFSRFSGSACGGIGGSCIASFTSDQIRGLDFLLQQAGQRPVAAANMSLGGGRSAVACDDDPTKPVIDQLRTAGVATAIASGNDGFRNAVSFPACISTAVTVGASSKQDRLAAFSNCSPTVDLNAPGVGIRSSVPGGGFSSFSGTSMATPHVAGAFAALRSANPDASVDAIENALKSTGPNVEGRPRIALLAAHRTLSPGQEVAVSSSPPSSSPPSSSPPSSPPPAGAPTEPRVAVANLAQIQDLPADKPVRAIVEVAPVGPGAAAQARALDAAEAAARAAGISSIERVGSQPLLVVECTGAQIRKLSQDAAVARVQVDRPARTQN